MKLTRKLVLAKAKASDLDSVKKLNCWGCSLADISIFSQIPNIEVLTLSVNNIASLAPLAACLSLCELYLRRNMISSLSELTHLRPLTRLKVLWLAENPCCGTDSSQYRLTVLRCLPRLQKLDNQVVTAEELTLALARVDGDDITTAPSPAQNMIPANGLSDGETENDPLNYDMEESSSGHQGRKNLPDKSLSLSSTRGTCCAVRNTSSSQKSHTLEAVLLLLKDLDEDELHIIQTATRNRLHAYTLFTEARETADIQH